MCVSALIFRVLPTGAWMAGARKQRWKKLEGSPYGRVDGSNIYFTYFRVGLYVPSAYDINISQMYVESTLIR
jgi:hypothetical protein